jgi:hypothetical protein
MEQKSERVLDSIESAMNLFKSYGMTNHLTEKELKMVLFELKQIASAGHTEAKVMLWNSNLNF